MRKVSSLVRTSFLLCACASEFLGQHALGQSPCQVTYIESPQPDARGAYGLAYDSAHDVVCLFGGSNVSNGRPFFNDLWEWHDGSWIARYQGVVRPPVRREAGLAYDRDRQRLVLFGGQSDSFTTLSDVWEWDGQAWTNATPSDTAARRRFAITYDEARHNVVVFGGLSGGTTLNETRTWNGSAWTISSSHPITQRQGAAMAYDARRGVVVLFGGLFGISGYQSDTWEWNGTTWTSRPTGVNTPPGRYLHAMAYDRNRQRVVIFGGFGVGGAALSDIWEYDGSGWTQMASAQEGPSARGFVSAAYEEDDHRTLAFGGWSSVAGENAFSGTWLWDGNQWSQAGSRVVPPSRVYPAIAYDPARSVTIVVGGRGKTSLLADTWEWDGNAWTQKTTQPGERPGVVERAAMCFDSSRNAAVHFGGQNDTLLSGETWEWMSGSWILASQTGPSPRRAHAMAYDPVRRQAVLFGGEDANGRNGETWVWNGLTWMQKSPTQSPLPRVHAAMAFDNSRGHVVLFGGYADNVGYSNDAWEWTGENWLPITFSGPLPPPRDEHGLYYDAGRGRLVVAGGLVGDGQPSNDAWELVGNSWSAIVDVPPTPRFGAGFVYDALRAEGLMVGGADNDRVLDQVWQLHSGSPEIVRGPVMTSTLGGGICELRVSARSDAPLAFTWRRNGAVLADGGNISGSRTSVLHISPVSLADAATYDVVVANSCGVTNSLAARVKVECPADLDDGSNTGTRDGGVTIDDLLYYLFIYGDGVPAADLDDGSGTGTPDGGVTIDDLLYYLAHYYAGC